MLGLNITFTVQPSRVFNYLCVDIVTKLKISFPPVWVAIYDIYPWLLPKTLKLCTIIVVKIYSNRKGRTNTWEKQCLTRCFWLSPRSTRYSSKILTCHGCQWQQLWVVTFYDGIRHSTVCECRAVYHLSTVIIYWDYSLRVCCAVWFGVSWYRDNSNNFTVTNHIIYYPVTKCRLMMYDDNDWWW